ncbi:ARM repeat-containing protein [Obba rivulosa]|uniref:Nucleolar protein 9 n=1 Tax=Obba rivulosa TaxID=1052685 RepID=A0A8E2DU44_9APHY|nr:ARM repeat-containing protein [Obba rivulosa]
MPRENRKRGKKHKKKADEEVHNEEYAAPEERSLALEQEAGPSWIVSAPNTPAVDHEAPFGYADSELKAYFRTVDVQIREWQEGQDEPNEDDEDVDPNENRRLFFVAALEEMSHKEKQLATDPDCSGILERMSYSMDDFVRRVFLDRLSGSLEILAKHRFASHVCQTIFTIASDTIYRESRGIYPPASESTDEGELRTLTQLVLDSCQEFIPSLSALVMDQFASHVIRAVLMLLAPHLSSEDSSQQAGKQKLMVRSKKSAAWKARQGPMKSVFVDTEAEKPARISSKEFQEAAAKFVMALREQLDENEVRALAANKVASPVLQMLLEIETAQDMADTPNSLMDRVLVGLITFSHSNAKIMPEASDYLATLLRDPTSSHLLETLVSHSPPKVFDILWLIYFKGKLSKLAVHPVANFVVARAFGRLSAEQLNEVCSELEGVYGKIIKASRTGVLRALVDRAAALHAHEARICDVICTAFDLDTPEDRKLLVHCILRLLPIQEYKAAIVAKGDQADKDGDEHAKRRGKAKAGDDPLEPKTQGAVLLQAMLRISTPHNEPILDSIQNMSIEELLEMAHHVTSSRVLDVVLDSPTVQPKAKRKFILKLIGHFHELVDDRIGSRVGDRCWASSDTYLKEKIARSLIPHERFLAGSFYGKFFARNLHLHLLQRNVEEWKNLQVTKSTPETSKAQPAPTKAAPDATSDAAKSSNADEQRKKKRKAHPTGEIDELFESTLGKRVKKGALGIEDQSGVAEKAKVQNPAVEKFAADKSLKDVMGAIRSAPKEDKGHQKKRKK